jgi:hypothetical protein
MAWRRNVRKLKIIEHISLNLIQAPGPTEDGDYPRGGWTVYPDPAVGSAILAERQIPQDSVLPPLRYK